MVAVCGTFLESNRCTAFIESNWSRRASYSSLDVERLRYLRLNNDGSRLLRRSFNSLVFNYSVFTSWLRRRGADNTSDRCTLSRRDKVNSIVDSVFNRNFNSASIFNPGFDNSSFNWSFDSNASIFDFGIKDSVFDRASNV